MLDMNFHDLSVFDTPFKTPQWETLIHQAKDIADEMGIEFSQGHLHFYNFCDPKRPIRSSSTNSSAAASRADASSASSGSSSTPRPILTA